VVLKRGRKASWYGRKDGGHAVHLLLYLQGHCFGNWKADIQLQRHCPVGQMEPAKVKLIC